MALTLHDRPDEQRLPLCPRCRLKSSVCICAEIPKIETGSRVVLLIHSLELKKATSSARLLRAALTNSEMRVFGVRDSAFELDDLAAQGRELLLLFPDAGKPALSVETLMDLSGPVTLLVPDGTWQQGKKIASFASQHLKVRRIGVPTQSASTYRLRVSPRAERLSTFEAVARALGVIESLETQAQLEQLFAVWVERSLSMRRRAQRNP